MGLNCRHRALVAAVVGFVCLVSLLGAPVTSAGTEPAPAGAAPQMSEEEMAKMMALMQPGEQHQLIGRLAGNWAITVHMWMGPGDPTVSEGTASYEWVLGGRYLVSHQTGSINGMPFEGMGIDGYDRGKQEYFNCWFDNFGTGLMRLSGQADPDSQGWTLRGSVFDPSQGKDIAVRTEIRLDSPDHYTYRMFQTVPGPDAAPIEAKVMEIAATRKK